MSGQLFRREYGNPQHIVSETCGRKFRGRSGDGVPREDGLGPVFATPGAACEAMLLQNRLVKPVLTVLVGQFSFGFHRTGQRTDSISNYDYNQYRYRYDIHGAPHPRPAIWVVQSVRVGRGSFVQYLLTQAAKK